MFLDTLSTVILQICDTRNWSYEAAAERCGLSSRYVGDIVRRKTAPTIRTLEKLCAGFQLLPNDLLVKPALTQELVFRVPMVVTQCRGRHTVLGFATYPICPHCQITLEREYQAYCVRCGQRLSWNFRLGCGPWHNQRKRKRHP